MLCSPADCYVCLENGADDGAVAEIDDQGNRFQNEYCARVARADARVETDVAGYIDEV